MKRTGMIFLAVWTAFLMCLAPLPASAENAWSQSIGSYAKADDGTGGRGLLMLKPLDEGCVLFDLSVSQTGSDSEQNVNYRVAGIFLIDEDERGLWEDRESGQKLSFSRYRSRVTVNASEPLPGILNGKYDYCSAAVNGTQPMLESFINYLPAFKTGLSAKENYQVRDVSDNFGEYRKILFVLSDGRVQAFWASPSLNQVLRIEGDKGVVIYQENTEK